MNNNTLINDVIEEVLDIFNIEFTLTIYISLDGTSILEDIDIIKLKKFNYREFEISSIKKLQKAAEKGEFELECNHRNEI